MTPAQQRTFVRQLIAGVRKDLLAKSDRWPKEWDGHELRALVEWRFKQANIGACSDSPHSKVARRKRAFINECYVRNLP